MKGLVYILALFFSINSAFAQYTLTDDDVEVKNGILKSYTGEEKDIIIPKELDGQLITVIGEAAFSWNQLTSVKLPNSVTIIDDYAFSENNLTSIKIPNSVTIIGDKAFSWNKLTSVKLPNSVKTIGDFAFYKNDLTSVELPNSVKSIGDWAFYGNKLASVKLEKGTSLTKIGKEAFGKNSTLEIKIPKDAKAKFVKYDGIKYKPGEVITIERKQ